MRRTSVLIAFVLFLILPASVAAQTRNAAFESYIDKYKDMAISQMNKYHIPASITLAQGLLESDAGRSTLAVEGNNHFGIKCHSDWTGKTLYHDDDRASECFRKYQNPSASFEDHSIFLASGKRYEFLFAFDQTDYKSWAYGLKKAGYATSPTYATNLIRIIETYELYQYDGKNGKSKAPSQLKHQPYISNGLLYVIFQDGENLWDISQEFDVSRYRLRHFNEIDRKYLPEPGSVIYLERKKGSAAKQYKTHVVQSGESLWDIAQLYGVRMKALIRKNHLDAENPLYVGMPLRVR